MQTSLEEIANKARKLKGYRFQNLYRMLNEEYLMGCWKQLNKKSAPGVDKVSYEAYGENLKENITGLVERLKAKRYRAKLVRRHYIPKGNGKMRPLGIPAMEDKLVQYAVAQILQTIYEADFLPCSYGYRPNRGAKEAVYDLQHKLFKGSRYHYVVEADIKGFFDNMDHEWIIRMLEQRINDKAFLHLIRKWLKAGILDTNGMIIHPLTGTPQGGIVSPVLANIYLHFALNLWFEKIVKKHCEGNAELWLYADDFVTAFERKEDAEKFFKVLGKRLGKFHLELSPEKTKLIHFSRYEKERNGTFEFLGFLFRWVVSKKGKDWLKLATSKKKFRNSLNNLKEWCKHNRNLPIRKLMDIFGAKLRGYNGYYGIIGNLDGIVKFTYLAHAILYKWLNRRSERRSYTWTGFHEMLRHFKIPKPKITDYTPALMSKGQNC